jgi:hypothetical protein
MSAESARLVGGPVEGCGGGYVGRMTESTNGPEQTDDGADASGETPDIGLVPDEDLPEDLQPTDDNPLAQDPDESGDDEPDPSTAKVEGMPDAGDPGPS